MTQADRSAESHGVARWTIAAANIVSATVAVVLLFRETTRHGADDSSGLLAALAHSHAALVGAWALSLVALVQMGRRRAQLVWGSVGLALCALLVATQTAVFGGHMRVLYAGGATLLGWLVGLAYAQWGAALRADEEAFAEAGALGCFAATYLGAAVSKLGSTGLDWVDPGRLQGVILSHISIQPSFATALSGLVAHHAWLAGSLAAATLVIQLGAVLMLLSDRFRMLWSALILLFHVNVLLILHIPYLPAMILAVGLAFPWHARRARSRAQLAGPTAGG